MGIRRTGLVVLIERSKIESRTLQQSNIKTSFKQGVAFKLVMYQSTSISNTSTQSTHDFRKTKKKNTSNTQLLKAIKQGQNHLILLNPLTHQARWKRKRCHPKLDFRWFWQAAHFSTINPINKPAMNYLQGKNLFVNLPTGFPASSNRTAAYSAI